MSWLIDMWQAAQDIWAYALFLLRLWPWFLGAVAVGYLLGMWLGWRGLLVIITLGGVLSFVLGRRNEPYPTDLPEKDARPPFRRRTAKREPPKSLIERVTGRPED